MSEDVVADLAIRLSGITSPFVEAWERAAAAGDAAATAGKQTRAARRLHRLAVKFWPRSQPDAWHGPWCLRGCAGVTWPPPELVSGYRESLIEGLRDAQATTERTP